jgi:hypothetical protein
MPEDRGTIMPDLTVDASRPPSFSTGAKVLAVLAFPEFASEPVWINRCADRLCRGVIEVCDRDDQPRFDAMEPAQPARAKATLRDFERAYRNSSRRVQNRMAAAQMVMPFFREALGLPKSQSPLVSQLSRHEMADLALSDMLEKNPNRIRSPVWARTQPVLHIATAAAIYDEVKDAGDPPIDFAHILVNVRVAKRVLHLADRILPVLRKLKQVDLANVDFVRIQVEG